MEVVAAGALVALAAFVALGPIPTPEEWKSVAFFAAFGIIATALAYSTSKATSGSIGFLPYLSAAIVSPNVAALVSVLLSTLVAEVVLRRPAIKLVFNVSQHLFAVAAGIFVYVLLGGTSMLHGSPSVIPFLALVLVYFTLNKLAVSTVVTAAEGSSTRTHWLKSMRGSALYDALAFPLILFFALTYSALGAGWSAVLAFPMLGIRMLYQAVFALRKVNEELLQLMVASIEARDPYTSGHSQRVARYARVIARVAGLNAKLVDRTEVSALLHDVGKIHEEFAEILRKPGALTDDEFAVMKTHPERSAELVEKVSHFADLVAPIRAHHEAWDGSGYPHRLSGSSIPLGARIIALADTIDAMTTSRPYREGLTLEQVRQEIRRVSGRQFDPNLANHLLLPSNWAQLVEAVEQAQVEYPIGPSATSEEILGNTGEFVAVSSSVYSTR